MENTVQTTILYVLLQAMLHPKLHSIATEALQQYVLESGVGLDLAGNPPSFQTMKRVVALVMENKI